MCSWSDRCPVNVKVNTQSCSLGVLLTFASSCEENAAAEVEVYYESRKREQKRRLIHEGRCDERLKAKVEESTCLAYTGLHDKTN
jgi:hypothetical protein